jgi:hypothetical protein
MWKHYYHTLPVTPVCIHEVYKITTFLSSVITWQKHVFSLLDGKTGLEPRLVSGIKGKKYSGILTLVLMWVQITQIYSNRLNFPPLEQRFFFKVKKIIWEMEKHCQGFQESLSYHYWSIEGWIHSQRRNKFNQKLAGSQTPPYGDLISPV